MLFRSIAYFFFAVYINITKKNVRVHLTSRIRPKSVFKGYNRVSKNTYFNGEIGTNSYIGSNTVLYAHVGNYCSIGSNVTTIIGNHPTNYVSTSPVFYSRRKQTGCTFADNELFNEILSSYVNGKSYGVQIGNDVWIGDNVLIKGGVKIGNGAIVAMGSVVVKDVAPYSIVGGVPAKLIKYRFDDETIRKLLKTSCWAWEIRKIKQYSKYMRNVDVFLSELGES